MDFLQGVRDVEHLFIVNPTAGKRDITPEIQRFLSDNPQLSARMHRTKAPGEATVYLRRYLASRPEPIRLYACGGDGTLNEVVNGAVGFPQASVGCYPCGSGNDFVKYYGGAGPFLDLKGLVDGREVPVDLIQAGERYAINACHFGFDTAVAAAIGRYKRFPLLQGRGAYLAAVARAFLFSMRSRCALTCDGEVFHEGNFLLCTIANGSHVGGAYRCAPRSRDDDGQLEVCLVDPVSRWKFLRLMGAYQRGEHLDDPRFSSCIHYRRARSMRLSASDGFALSLDGEVVSGQDFSIRVLPQALRFILPRSLSTSMA